MRKHHLEKLLWLFQYNTGSRQASHIKLIYAWDSDDARTQVQHFVNRVDRVVNEERLDPMPGGFSTASRFFPGRVQTVSNC